MAAMLFAFAGQMLGGALLGPIGAAIGGIVGSLVGNMLMKPETQFSHIDGPRLSDRSPPTSQYGAVIPRVWGTGRIGTNLIWSGDMIEKVVTTTNVTEGGGKGGGGGGGKSVSTQTTYYYYGVWASLIGKGPIVGVKRIWMNGILAYDADKFAKDDVKKLSQDFKKHFTVYRGTESQPQSPLIQAKEGATTPAYRGYAYIVFNDVLLERFGNRIPNVEVEVVSEGSGDYPIYEDPVPLHRIVGQMLNDVGLTDDQFDVTQLTDLVRGYSDQEAAPLATKLEKLAQAYLFDVVESDGIMKFVKQPAPTIRREYREPCLINEDGLLVNAFHTEVGRQGYFDPASGTSEGQFTVIKACIKAWETETDPAEKKAWLDRAEFMASALEPILYRRAVPADPDAGLWVPHWLFAVKNPIQLQSWMKVRLTFREDGASRNTRLRAYIPNGPGYYGERIKTVYQVYRDRNSYLLWDNPYSAVIGDSERMVEWGQTDGRTWVEIAKTAPYKEDGKAVTDERDAVVVFAVNAGPMLSVSEGYEAWPHWRGLEPGEIDCATDTLYWALDAYDMLSNAYAAMGNAALRDKWRDAYNATKASLVSTHDVKDGRDFFKPMLSSSAFSMAGTFEASARPGCGPAIWTRNARTGIISGKIPASNVIIQGEVKDAYGNVVKDPITGKPMLDQYTPVFYEEAQIGRGMDDTFRLTDDFIRVRVGSSKPTDKVYIWLDTTLEFNVANRYYAKLDLKGTGEIEQIDLPRSAFKRMFYSGVDPKPTTPTVPGFPQLPGTPQPGATGGKYVASEGIRDVKLLSGVQEGIYTIRPESSSEHQGMRVRDPKGKDLGQMVQRSEGGSENYTVWWEFNGPEISFRTNGSGILSGTINVSEVGENPSGAGGTYPHPDKDMPIKACGFSYFGKDAITFMIERVRPMPEIKLPYTPYITPFTVNLMDNQLIEWRGSPGSGYTFPHGWAMIGNAKGVEVQTKFLRDAQDAYQKEFGYRGPFMPAYVWDRSDTQVLGTPNTWTFEWHDPNTEWGGYKYRPYESVARAAYMTGRQDCKQCAFDFAKWLDGHWPGGTAPPTNFKRNGLAVTEYDEPHFAAYVLRASIWMELGGFAQAYARSLATKSYNYIATRFINAPGKRMHGSFANAAVPNPDPDNILHWQWYGFWHAEIVETLATLLKEGRPLMAACGFDENLIRACIRGSNLFMDRWTRKIQKMDVDDLGANEEGGDPRPSYIQGRVQEIELPLEVEVKFANPDLAYGSDVRYARRLNVKTRDKRTFDLPMAMTGPEAELLANRLLYIAWLRRNQWQFTLPLKYFVFDPGDVIVPTIRGEDKPVFITKATYGGAMMELGGFDHDPEVYRETAFVSTREAPRLPDLSPPGDTHLFVMNLPLLRQEHVAPVYYLAASGGRKWQSGSALRSVDGKNWTRPAVFPTYSTMGNTVGAPGDGPIHVFDERSTITVILLKGTLESVGDDALLAGANAAMVGDEIIQFGKAELRDDGTWLLSHLLRGRLGTEWAVPHHTQGERFVLLNEAIIPYQDVQTDINRTVYWKGVTTGQNDADGVWQTFVNDGRSLKPYSPVHITGTRNSAGDLTITWIRRTRIPSGWTDGAIDVPLGEAVERYEVDIVDEAGNVKRTFTNLTSPTVTYTAAQQEADFGAIQYWVRPRVYQMSAVVGRGYPGTPYEGGV